MDTGRWWMLGRSYRHRVRNTLDWVADGCVPVPMSARYCDCRGHARSRHVRDPEHLRVDEARPPSRQEHARQLPGVLRWHGQLPSTVPERCGLQVQRDFRRSGAGVRGCAGHAPRGGEGGLGCECTSGDLQQRGRPTASAQRSRLLRGVVCTHEGWVTRLRVVWTCCVSAADQAVVTGVFVSKVQVAGGTARVKRQPSPPTYVLALCVVNADDAVQRVGTL